MKIQTTAKILGYAGLIPFVGLAILNYLQIYPNLNIAAALLFYGAIILSFIGALHWGFGMSLGALSHNEQNWRLIWSVIPALIAWFALLCPIALCVYLLITGFLLQLWQDYRLTRISEANIPDWYFSLRWQLTLVGTLSLISVLIRP